MTARRNGKKSFVILPELPPEAIPNIDDLVIDDGAAVDGIYSEKQMRLLTEPLYSSWEGPGKNRSFLALANVGLFYQVGVPPLVPDVMLSVDVRARNLSEKRNNTYFVWEFGKSPETVIEIVSNKGSDELGDKLIIYARIGVPYYIVWDPMNYLKMGKLQSFILQGKEYEENGLWFKEPNLDLTQWEGSYEGTRDVWLRWTDERGRLIPTGAEKSQLTQKRARKAEQRAKESDNRAKKAEQGTERLKAKLRSLGIKPEDA